jgi:hypothetical protein
LASADCLSKRASAGKPDAIESQVGLLDDQVVVVVVVQHSETVAVGERRDEQVDRWQAMSDARELRLRVEGALLDSVIQVILGEGEHSAKS